MNNLKLTIEEQNLLNDLLILNKRLKEVFFSKEKDYKFITMIDDTIQEKINNMEPWVAYKMLNQLYKLNIIYSYPGTEVKILNEQDCDLPKERLSILLLSNVLNDTNYIDYFSNNCMLGFYYYTLSNMLGTFYGDLPILNYLFILGHMESFLGLINDNSTINSDIKNDTINKFLFLYRDLEIEFRTKNMTEKSTNVLANRYNALAQITIGVLFPSIKNMISIDFFCQEAFEMLKINDDKIVDYSRLIIGKHYLDNLLNHISSYGFDELLQSYEEMEEWAGLEWGSLDNHQKALKYIHNSLDKKKKRS